VGVFLDIINKPSVFSPKEIDIGIPLQPEPDLVAMITEPSDWTTPYYAFVEHKIPPTDKTEV